MKLSVVIVSYNVRYFLEQCLHSVNKAASLVETEVWVVDNNSADGSPELVTNHFPEINLIRSDKNLGFSKANNLAIRKSKGEYILLLNPDTLVEEDTFLKVVTFMDQHPEAGGLGVHMIDGKGNFLPESKRGLPTPAVAFYKMSGLSRLFPRSKKFGRYHLGFLDKDETHQVEVLSGAFMLLRKETLDKVGLLDEEYFMYGEDIDLSYRIIKEGYKNYYYPGTKIIHYKGESTRKSSVNYVVVFYNAMRIFAKKHFTQKRARLFGMLINLAIFARGSAAIVSRALKSLFIPLMDAFILYLGLTILRYYWEHVVRAGEGLHFATEVQTIAFPVFILIWLASIFLSGGYETPVKLSRIFKGVVAGSAVILLIYSVLPEQMRFSRAVVLLGSAFAVVALPLFRLLLSRTRLQGAQLEQSREKRVAIVADKEEFERVKNLLKQTPGSINIIGRINPGVGLGETGEAIGSLDRMGELLFIYGLNEVIFAAKDLPAHEIIKQMSVQSESDVSFKIAPPESLFIIGSNSIDTQGELYGIQLNSIGKSSNRRSKRTFDIIGSLVLLITLPIHLILVKRPGGLIRNIFNVLSGKNSWVGYNESGISDNATLPKIKRGILTPVDNLSGRSASEKAVVRLNQLYAKDYQWESDFQTVFRNYRLLGRAVNRA